VQDETPVPSGSPAPTISDMPAPTVGDVLVTLEGPPVPPQGRIQLYSADEWEEFIREWATGLETDYVQIKRFGGSGDKGADVAAFKSDQGLEGPWDCFQGKHYSRPLNFSDAAAEILKVLQAVLDGHYRMPDSYQFLAPRGCGTDLNRLLSLPSTLKTKFLSKLVPGQTLVAGLDAVRLEAARKLAEETDFSRFKSVEILDALETHRLTCYHTSRFGTALKIRSVHEQPPEDIAEHETRYLEQLLAVYIERHPDQTFDMARLATGTTVGSHFQRQRVYFYKAESLRVYARDSVPVGTFEKLQDDIHSGVIETAEAEYSHGFARLANVLSLVGQLDLNRHRLIAVSDNDDRKGICHQLANNDRLTWVVPS
jgi:hypothetical protein